MKVSVIMPVYNVEEYLAESIQSVLNQSFKDFELLIVDDGSTDSSGLIADTFEKKDERITVIHQKNAGQSAARNTAIERCNGEYIIFVDSDDLIAHNYIERLLELKKQYGADSVITSYQKFSDTPINKKSSKLEVFSGKEYVRKAIGPRVLGLYAWGRIFRKELFNDHKFPVGKIYEDMLLIPYLMYDMEKIVYTHENLYFYRQRSNSSMATYTPSRGYEIYAIEKLIEFARLKHDRMLCWLASINEIRSWIEIKRRFKKKNFDFTQIETEMQKKVITAVKFLFFPFFSYPL